MHTSEAIGSDSGPFESSTPGLSRPGPLRLAVIFALYLGATQTFMFVSVTPENVALLWLPNAVVAVALLITPRRMWWQVCVVSIAAEIVGDALLGIGPQFAALFGVVNVVEAGAFVLLARTIGRGDV